MTITKVLTPVAFVALLSMAAAPAHADQRRSAQSRPWIAGLSEGELTVSAHFRYRRTMQTVCPHCKSPTIAAMHERFYEEASSVTWYQCKRCRRMWSLAKPPVQKIPDDNSPES